MSSIFYDIPFGKRQNTTTTEMFKNRREIRREGKVKVKSKVKKEEIREVSHLSNE